MQSPKIVNEIVVIAIIGQSEELTSSQWLYTDKPEYHWQEDFKTLTRFRLTITIFNLVVMTTKVERPIILSAPLVFP